MAVRCSICWPTRRWRRCWLRRRKRDGSCARCARCWRYRWVRSRVGRGGGGRHPLRGRFHRPRPLGSGFASPLGAGAAAGCQLASTGSHFAPQNGGPELGSRPWPAQPADPADSGGQPHASANRLVPPCSPAGSRPRAGLEPLQAPPGRPRPDEVGAGFGAPSRSRDGNPDATGADPPLPPPALA